MGIWTEEGRLLNMGIGREAERDSLGANPIAICSKGNKQTNEGRKNGVEGVVGEAGQKVPPRGEKPKRRARILWSVRTKNTNGSKTICQAVASMEGCCHGHVART
jgi:hypothetical protein